jgi:Peptidase M1 N-terminal domain
MKITPSAFSFFLLTSSSYHSPSVGSSSSSISRIPRIAFATAFANHNQPSFYSTRRRHNDPKTNANTKNNIHRMVATHASSHENEKDEIVGLSQCVWHNKPYRTTFHNDIASRYHLGVVSHGRDKVGISTSVRSSILSVRAGSSSMSSTTAITATATTESEDIVSSSVPATEYFRRDYQPLPFTVKDVALNFQIFDGQTIVSNTFTIIKNPVSSSKDHRLVLDGDDNSVTLISISMNNKELIEGIDFLKEPNQLILLNPNDSDVITTKVSIVPEQNTQLSGLYKSSGMFCTQCEAMGFRRITYFPDRPDNMSIYQSVRIEADKASYPILLSNGNCIDQGDVNPENDTDPQRHYVVWQDPFPKPSYLFAMVAGSLGSIEDEFITKSGRHVKLVIYSEPHHVHKLQYAMESLKRSMKWDEDRFNVSIAKMPLLQIMLRKRDFDYNLMPWNSRKCVWIFFIDSFMK